jgi:hypothetical protein
MSVWIATTYWWGEVFFEKDDRAPEFHVKRKDAMNYGYSLSTLVAQSEHLEEVRKEDLHLGDRIVVVTLNSVYSIRVDAGGLYVVSGGWFDRKGKSPATTTIAGCTWGGSAVKIDTVAACGLCLEFGNRLITSRIKKILLFRHGIEN